MLMSNNDSSLLWSTPRYYAFSTGLRCPEGPVIQYWCPGYFTQSFITLAAQPSPTSNGPHWSQIAIRSKAHISHSRLTIKLTSIVSPCPLSHTYRCTMSYDVVNLIHILHACCKSQCHYLVKWHIFTKGKVHA
jgi:hypothetical protein